MAQNPLTTYLKANGIRQGAFAKKIGRTQATISRICAGERGVTLDTAALIEAATDGAVPISAWVSRNEGSAT